MGATSRPVVTGFGFALGACALAGIFLLTRRSGGPAVGPANSAPVVAMNDQGPKELTAPNPTERDVRPAISKKDASSKPPTGHLAPPKTLRGKPRLSPKATAPVVTPELNNPPLTSEGDLTVAAPDPNAKPRAFLVGKHGIYDLTLPDAHEAERRDIEQAYADRVAAIQATCQEMDRAGDAAGADQKLNDDLAAAEKQREDALDRLYVADYVAERERPEFAVESESPYQVVRVEPAPDRDPAKRRIVLLSPWAGYVPDDAQIFGWTYGHAYTLTQWQSLHRQWAARWQRNHRMAFFGLNGSHGTVSGLSAQIEPSGNSYVLRRTPAKPADNRQKGSGSDESPAKPPRTGSENGPKDTPAPSG